MMMTFTSFSTIAPLLVDCWQIGVSASADHSQGPLPVSAEPGLTHDILVSRTSVRRKACNQVTGRCKGGGLESPPTNKLHMSTPGERKFSQKLMGLEACNLPDAVGLTETRRRHPLNAVYEIGEELFLGTCDSRGVGGVDVLVNTCMAKNIDSVEQLTTRIGRLRMRRCGPTPALTIFVAYAPTSSYDEEEVEAFYMDLKKSSTEKIMPPTRS
ncbi:hypothetical protein RB195_023463 [Necator americanus]|uniref:Uncharacterized protein n=1 Tax=Necator americanus TaxID=51031 RepID=A0ABR1EJB5_NECAM